MSSIRLLPGLMASIALLGFLAVSTGTQAQQRNDEQAVRQAVTGFYDALAVRATGVNMAPFDRAILVAGEAGCAPWCLPTTSAS